MMVVVECIYLPKGLWSWKHEPESVAEGEGRGGVEEEEWKRAGGWSRSM